MLTTESIAPAATAVAPGRPWHWKKRMLTAMRPRLDGIARFRYDVVSSFMYTGPKGSRAAIDPSVDTACVSRGSWATTKPTAIQPQAASERSERTASQSTLLAPEMTAAAASTRSASWIAVHQVTRRSLTRSGTSASTAVATVLRRSSMSMSAAFTAFRSGVRRAADWR